MIQTIESFTDFNPSSGVETTPYASGAFTDPTMSAQAHAAPVAAPAVPEPSSLTLFGVAAGMFAGYRGWRRRKQASIA
ncbi:MAG TPA: PEP-CTERM sorting domain-containing protein [Pirellulales bacterium]|nr:PEP-CTERM sorting domain-containing protein [Pirellulales bacterium]